MRFANPYYLLLILPALLIVFLFLRGVIGREAGLKFSSLNLVKHSGARPSATRRFLSGLLRLAGLILLIVALARPQTFEGGTESQRDVVDIMLAIDISSSMATLDFHPDNRLEAAKIEAKRFILKRPHDRIGLVVFAKHSFTQSPLTIDHAALLNLVNRIQIGMIEDGTAIGVGLANAINRLRDSDVKSKVVVLLTDGINNSGKIDPLTAADIAKEFGIRAYTVGIGIEGEALFPVYDPAFGTRFARVVTEIDEETLRKIARITGGIYFRAKDEEALRNVFSKIDELERTKIIIEQFTRYEDLFHVFVLMGLVFLVLDILLTQFLIVKVP